MTLTRQKDPKMKPLGHTNLTSVLIKKKRSGHTKDTKNGNAQKKAHVRKET